MADIQINVNVIGEATDVPYIHSDSGAVYQGVFDPVYPWRCIFHLPISSPPAGWGASINWDGKSERFIVPVEPGSYEGSLLQPIPIHNLVYPPPIPPVPPLPEIPSREAVCGINLTFQGLTIGISTGIYPWFELGFQCQNSSDRELIYHQKHLARDTHLILQFQNGREVYNSVDEQPYKHMFSPDFTANPEDFKGLVREVIVNGFIPIVAFDGDNADNEPYGYPNALRQLPILSDLFSTGEYLVPYILFARLWDGVFYGSSPENIEEFGRQFRLYFPEGYLAIQHNTGHIPVGGGPEDYTLNGRMRDYDVIISQFSDNLHQDSTWQIAGRTIRPYHRPPDQPINDDPNPPMYLIASIRGERYACAFEWNEYFWVRDRISAAEIEHQRSYLRSLGYRYLG